MNWNSANVHFGCAKCVRHNALQCWMFCNTLAVKTPSLWLAFELCWIVLNNNRVFSINRRRRKKKQQTERIKIYICMFNVRACESTCWLVGIYADSGRVTIVRTRRDTNTQQRSHTHAHVRVQTLVEQQRCGTHVDIHVRIYLGEILIHRRCNRF